VGGVPRAEDAPVVIDDDKYAEVVALLEAIKRQGPVAKEGDLPGVGYSRALGRCNGNAMLALEKLAMWANYDAKARVGA